MSTVNLSPGVHNVKIYTDNNEEISFEIYLKKKQDNKIKVEFSLTGLDKLKNPIDNNLTAFYLYVLLSYHHGGKDINFISSADVYFDEEKLEMGNLRLVTTVDIPIDFVYDDEDFLWSYYSLDIVHSSNSAEDGSDLYRLLRSDKLFSTKLNVVIEDEVNG